MYMYMYITVEFYVHVLDIILFYNELLIKTCAVHVHLFKNRKKEKNYYKAIISCNMLTVIERERGESVQSKCIIN